VQVVATATIAAIVGSGGLGRFVVDGFVTQDQGQYIGGALLVAVLAVAVEVALGRLERWVTPGARATGSAASIDPSLTVAGNATAGG
jgi:osmoprotectant transport system permease protein